MHKDKHNINKKNNISIDGKEILLCVISFIVTLSLLAVFLIVTTLIPRSKIKDNMVESANNYKNCDAFEFAENGKYYTVKDNYADTILLNVLWNMDEDNPVYSSIDTKYHNGEYDGTEYGTNVGLYLAVNGEEPNTDYTRYWHGSVIFVRLLLLITDIAHIKRIGMVVAIILMVICIVLLIMKKQYNAAIAFAAGWVCTRIWDISNAIEYQAAVIIAMIITLLFIIFEEKGNKVLIILSVISGTLVAFFDFLTAETLTILVPLATVFLIREKKGEIKEVKENAVFMMKALLAWALSYAAAFIAKWSAASLITGTNKFYEAMSSVSERVNGLAEEGDMSPVKQIFFAVFANISTLFGGKDRVSFGNIAAGLIVSALVLFSVYYLFRKEKSDKNKSIVIILFIIMSIPYIRYLVLNNHSYLHEFFTYRAQAASIMALIGLLGTQTDFSIVNG